VCRHADASKTQHCHVRFAGAVGSRDSLLNLAEHIVVVRRDRFLCLGQTPLKVCHTLFWKHPHLISDARSVWVLMQPYRWICHTHLPPTGRCLVSGAGALVQGDGPLWMWEGPVSDMPLDSALCLPPGVVLVEGRDEGKPGGLHDIGGRRPDRDPAARQLHLELDLSDRLAARAD
jgi:hypothetical protein